MSLPTCGVVGVRGGGTGLKEASHSGRTGLKEASHSRRTGLKEASHSKRCSAVAAALIVFLLGGCSSLPWARVPLDTTTGFYDSASLVYRIDAGALQQSLDVLRVERQQLGYEQVASSPQPNQTIGTLSITNPHPLGRSGMAQAQFTLTSGIAQKSASIGTSWTPWKKKTVQPPALSTIGSLGEIEEQWVLDIPASEANQLVQMLSTQGFYDSERSGAVGVQLSATLNGRQVTKSWEQVPQLNALAQRVRREGQLIAYHRSSAAAGKPAQQIASTRAYSDLIASLGNRAAPGIPAATAMPSPFAMAPPPQQGVPIASAPVGPTR